MPEGLYTAAGAAEELGITPRRVTGLARRLGIGSRHGWQWAFTAADIEALRARNTKTGPKGKKESEKRP